MAQGRGGRPGLRGRLPSAVGAGTVKPARTRELHSRRRFNRRRLGHLEISLERPDMRVLRLIGLVVLCAALLAAPHTARAANPPPESAFAWQRDLDYMVQCIEKYHVNAFHSLTRAVFEGRVSALRARMPRLDRAQAILGLASIIALVRDAHTGFGLGTAPPISFHAFPRPSKRPVPLGCELP
jgi:hypothetical protein